MEQTSDVSAPAHAQLSERTDVIPHLEPGQQASFIAFKLQDYAGSFAEPPSHARIARTVESTAVDSRFANGDRGFVYSQSDVASSGIALSSTPLYATCDQSNGTSGDAALASISDCEPPEKQRRSGRRVANPTMSPEERRRQRTLKNRESAMRSLQKKAEYAAKLESDEKSLRDAVLSQRNSLITTMNAANEARLSLSGSTEHMDLLERVDACLQRCRDALAKYAPGDVAAAWLNEEANLVPQDCGEPKSPADPT